MVLKRYVRSQVDYEHLFDYFESAGITFLTILFDTAGANTLSDFGVSAIKLDSGNSTTIRYCVHRRTVSVDTRQYGDHTTWQT